MNVVELPSPNFDERNGAPIDMLVMHYTGMPTAQAALERLRDPMPGKRVSAHYVVDEDGTIYRMVPEDKRAWHAGNSEWRGRTDINRYSIGIEIVNPGHEHGYRPFPKAQMDSVAALAKSIVERHNIPSWNVVAHSDIAPLRKEDPGELFDWKSLAAQGVGLWPEESKAGGFDPLGWVMRVLKQGARAIAGGGSVLDMQKKLKSFGYPTPLCGTYGQDTQATVTAFQRHYRQNNVNGQWDAECEEKLDNLLSRAPTVRLAESSLAIG